MQIFTGYTAYDGQRFVVYENSHFVIIHIWYILLLYYLHCYSGCMCKQFHCLNSADPWYEPLNIKEAISYISCHKCLCKSKIMKICRLFYDDLSMNVIFSVSLINYHELISATYWHKMRSIEIKGPGFWSGMVRWHQLPMDFHDNEFGLFCGGHPPLKSWSG